MQDRTSLLCATVAVVLMCQAVASAEPPAKEFDFEAAALPLFGGRPAPPPDRSVVPGPWLDPAPDLGGMEIYLSGSATMLVIDAVGQRAGFVAGHPEAVQGIPRAAFFVDGVPGRHPAVVHSFHVHTADVAPYTVQVIGVPGGAFTLSVDIIGPDGSTERPTSVTGAIALGQVKTYAVVPRGARATISRR